MSVTRDILRSYRDPGAVMRGHLARGPREDRALMFLMLGCLLIFVAQTPRLSREAAMDPDIAFAPLAGAELFVWLFVAPLFFYGLAALGHIVARIFGGRGDWFGARMALFWTLVAVSPVVLLRGLVAGFVGSGLVLDLVGAILLGFFGYVWFANLRAAERPADVETAVQGA